MSGAETARRPVVQCRIDSAETAAPKWPSPHFLHCFSKSQFRKKKMLTSFIRPVTEEGVVCTCLDIRSVNFFCFLKTSIPQLRMVEHLKVRQNSHF